MPIGILRRAQSTFSPKITLLLLLFM